MLLSVNGSDFLTVDAKEVFFTYAALRAAIQAFTVLDNSESTPESVLPDRFRTWKEWSAPSMICRVGCGPRLSQMGLNNDKSARSSRGPCKKSIGSFTSCKC